MFSLVGNPPSVGIGEWSSLNQGVLIVNPLNPYSEVSGIAPGETAELIWTTTNGTCSSTDIVELYSLEGGCMNPSACNYDQEALCDNGNCILPDGNGDCPNQIEGCVNPLACNYDINALVDNGSCLLPDGCVDLIAVNYDPIALCDNGTCLYQGCTDIIAENYNPEATFNDGSCQYVLGCTYVNSVNYNPNATLEDNSCNFCMGDFNEDGSVNVSDLGGFLGAFGNVCQ